MLDIYKTFLSNTRQIVDISHIHLSFKSMLQYIVLCFATTQFSYIHCIYAMYIYMYIITSLLLSFVVYILSDARL